MVSSQKLAAGDTQSGLHRLIMGLSWWISYKQSLRSWTSVSLKVYTLCTSMFAVFFSKLDEIRLMMCNSKVGIVCFSETWLDASISDTEIEIENYVVLRKDRNRNGGGICVYIRADICFNRRMDLNHDLIEAVWFDVQLTKSKPILIGALYRPPDQNNFYQLLEESFVPGSDFKDEVIMIGDFNTDVSNKEHGMYKAFNVFCQVFDLQQLIKEPTRVAKMSQTVIDLILVSEQSMISQSGVVNCTMSDHSLIYCTRKKYKVVLKK